MSVFYGLRYILSCTAPCSHPPPPSIPLWISEPIGTPKPPKYIYLFSPVHQFHVGVGIGIAYAIPIVLYLCTCPTTAGSGAQTWNPPQIHFIFLCPMPPSHLPIHAAQELHTGQLSLPGQVYISANAVGPLGAWVTWSLSLS